MAQAGTAARIFAVILAAGESRRFGRPKQLEVFEGETLVARAAGFARHAIGDDVVLVVGSEAKRVAEATAMHAPEVVFNARYREGMGTSLACAAVHLAERADALLVMLADQPCISATHLAAIRSTWRAAPEAIVATTFGGTPGPPVLLPQETFSDLMQLSGDNGARHLFDDRRFQLRTIELPEARIDIDTREDLAKLVQDSV